MGYIKKLFINDIYIIQLFINNYLLFINNYLLFINNYLLFINNYLLFINNYFYLLFIIIDY